MIFNQEYVNMIYETMIRLYLSCVMVNIMWNEDVYSISFINLDDTIVYSLDEALQGNLEEYFGCEVIV